MSPVDIFMAGFATTLKNDGRVVVPGFGRFVVATRKARSITHPITKLPYWLEAKQEIRFKSFKALREAVLSP